MSENGGGQPVVINVGECRCPGLAHAPEGDTVSLRPAVSVPMGAAAAAATAELTEQTVIGMQAAFAPIWMHFGIIDWTFVDDDGPIPVTPDNIDRMLPWNKGGAEVYQRANDIYFEDFTSPLVRLMLPSSARGRTGASTSATNGSGRKHRSPSKPSSPAGSVTNP